jgi:D-threo-aldose 1-dehydrogenase
MRRHRLKSWAKWSASKLSARNIKSLSKAAALHFSLAHPAAAAIIPGASKPQRSAEDHAALKETIPDDFWHEMRKQGLVAANAPLPIDIPEEAAHGASVR